MDKGWTRPAPPMVTMTCALALLVAAPACSPSPPTTPGAAVEAVEVPYDMPLAWPVFRFARAARDGAKPERAIFHYRGMEAIEGPLGPQWLQLPDDAPMMFEAWTALEDPLSGPARVMIRVMTASGASTEVTSELPPEAGKWTLHQADLSDFSGQPVRIDATVSGPAAPDAVLWGGPMVYAMQAPEAFTPIILISCDTLRAQNVSSYGYDRETTPNIDAIAADGVLFETAIVEETWTLPSHMTMLTGLHPNRHRVTPSANLSADIPTVTESLTAAGYRAAGFTGSSLWMYDWRGHGNGFDLYDTPQHLRDVFTTHDRVNDWLDRHGHGNFFLFIHNFDIHSQPVGRYRPEPYGPADDRFLHYSLETAAQLDSPPTEMRKGMVSPLVRQHYLNLYDDAIRSVDHAIGELVARLKEEGLYDNALIIVTSDHGEELGERGVFGHTTTYEECARVPLIVKFPNGRFAGERIGHMVQLADLFPTIAAVAGIGVPDDLDGVDLAALIEGDEAPREVSFIQSEEYRASRSDTTKFISFTYERMPEFFDLVEDEAEQHNLFGRAPAEAIEPLRSIHEAFYAEQHTGWHIAMRGWGTPWSGTATFTADTQIVTNRADDTPHTTHRTFRTNGTHTLVIEWDGEVFDDVVLNTEPPGRPITARFEHTDSFLVRMGRDEFDRVEAFSQTLDATVFTPPPPRGLSIIPQGGPSLSIWYAAPPREGEAAREMTAEEQELLEALGYH